VTALAVAAELAAMHVILAMACRTGSISDLVGFERHIVAGLADEQCPLNVGIFADGWHFVRTQWNSRGSRQFTFRFRPAREILAESLHGQHPRLVSLVTFTHAGG